MSMHVMTTCLRWHYFSSNCSNGVISLHHREGNSWSSDTNHWGGRRSHFVHVLGCQERLRLQFSRALLDWCHFRGYSLLPPSGIYDHRNSLSQSFASGISFWVSFTTLLWQIFLPLGKISVMVYGCIAALVFCGYIIYDTDNLIKRYSYDEYIWASVALYLDIINLFLSLLTIFRAADR